VSRPTEKVRRQKAEAKSQTSKVKSSNGFGNRCFESAFLALCALDLDSVEEEEDKKKQVFASVFVTFFMLDKKKIKIFFNF